MTLIAETDLWMSWGPTVSMLHYDADNILNCMFGDTDKEWIFVNTTEHL